MTVDVFVFWRFSQIRLQKAQTSDESISVILHTANALSGLYELLRNLEIMTFSYRENFHQTWQCLRYANFVTVFDRQCFFAENDIGGSKLKKKQVTCSTKAVISLLYVTLVRKLQIVEHAIVTWPIDIWLFLRFRLKNLQTSQIPISITFYKTNMPSACYELERNFEIIYTIYRENGPQIEHISTCKFCEHVRLPISLVL